MPVQRYGFYVNSEDDTPTVESELEPDGDYVSFEDYQKLLDIVKDLSLCVDEYGESIGTHYILNTQPLPKVMPKGSFIVLVQRAKDAVEA